MCQACEQKISVEDVLKITSQSLRNIYIPVELSESVGITVSNAIRNLQACVEALENAQATEEEKLEVTGEPVEAEDPAEEDEDDGDLDAE